MNIYSTCGKCNGASVDKDVQTAIIVTPDCVFAVEEKCKGFRGKRLRERIGNTDVERMAVAIYNEFHNGDEWDDEPWPLYRSANNDEVIRRFREAAHLVRAVFEDGLIGSMYYREDDDD